MCEVLVNESVFFFLEVVGGGGDGDVGGFCFVFVFCFLFVSKKRLQMCLREFFFLIY